MALTVEINSVDQSDYVSRDHRISWERDVNGQGQASLVIGAAPSDLIPDDGQEVVIKEDGSARFGGYINGRPRQIAGPDRADPFTLYTVRVGSYELRLRKRPVFYEYVNMLIEDIADHINANFLDSEGFTVSCEAGATKHTIAFNGEDALAAFESLCEIEADGRTVRVTTSKVITIETVGSTPAPATLDEDNIELNNPKPSYEPDREAYANRVTVIGGNPDMPITYTAQDATEIAARAAAEGGSGVYHKVFTDQEARTSAQVQLRAEGILAQMKTLRDKFVGKTDEAGFDAGQQVTVDLPNLGLSSATLFITRVATVADPGSRNLHHTVTAVSGDPEGSWQSYYRKAKAKTIPMQVQAAPGIVRIDPAAGVLCHDPTRNPGQFYQGALSGTLASTPSAIGVIHRLVSGGNDWGNYAVTLRRGPVATPRQQILELWEIDADEKIAQSAAYSYTWDELAANANFKSPLAVDQTSTYVAFVQYGSPGSLGVVNIRGAGFQGSVACNMSAQTAAGEPVWVGDYLYIPNVSDGKIYIYDLSDPASPSEVGSFATSLSAIFSLRASADGLWLYGVGTGGFFALDKSDAENLGPQLDSGTLQIDVNSGAGTFTRSSGSFVTDGFEAGMSVLGSGFANAGNNDYFIIDTVSALVITVVDATGMVTETGSGDEQLDAIEDCKIGSTGDYQSLALSEEEDLIGAVVRQDSSNARVVTIDVAAGSIEINTEDTVAAAIGGTMDGRGAILRDGALGVFNQSNPVGANSLECHVFDVTDPANPTFTETLSYVHGAAGNIGPAISPETFRALYTFNFNDDAQLTYAADVFDKVAPYIVGAPAAGALADDPVPLRFGGTQISEGVRGSLWVPTDRQAAQLLSPPARTQDKLIADYGEDAAMRWEENELFKVVEIDDTDSPYTVLGGDDVILAGATAGPITVNLPAVADSLNRLLIIKNDGDGTNDVTVSPNGVETIDGDLLRTLGQDEVLAIVGSANEWEVIIGDGANGNVLRGYIDGLCTENAADADHDIKVQPGAASAVLTGDDALLELGAAITKQIDAAWAEGDGVGGLASGTVAADTEYNLLLITKDADGTVDWMFDTSAAGANVPSGWTARRRFWSVFTDGAANIRPYQQAGDVCQYETPVTDVNDNSGTIGVFETGTLTAPGDTMAILQAQAIADNCQEVIALLQLTDGGGPTNVFIVRADGANEQKTAGGATLFRLNAQSQVDYSLNAFGAGSESWNRVRLKTVGWFDERGRNAKPEEDEVPDLMVYAGSSNNAPWGEIGSVADLTPDLFSNWTQHNSCAWDDGATEGMSRTIPLAKFQGLTVDAYLIFGHSSGAAGGASLKDVRIQFDIGPRAAKEAQGAPNDAASYRNTLTIEVAPTAGANQHVPFYELVGSFPVGASDVVGLLECSRLGADGADTFNASLGVIGVYLVAQ